MTKKTLSAALMLGLCGLAGTAFASEQAFYDSMAKVRAQALSAAQIQRATLVGRGKQAEPQPPQEGISGISYVTDQVDANTPWERITYPYIPYFSTYFFKNFGFTVDMLCVNGDKLERKGPKKTVTDCQGWSGGNDRHDPVCTKPVEVFVAIPLTYQEEVCVQWKPRHDGPVCVATELKTVTRPLTQKVDVYKVRDHRGGDKRDLAFTKEYTIPACQP
ncbi:MAG TPA: hypothetical protein DEB40_05570 [Elusimicrobia bacterium]|nr:hypothetical protein [Elusimicrobiota bacterium]HBT61194.1 hypothetical protein [Elusimicrobiota bacterium]